MDSRLKKQVIAVAIVMVAAVIATVFGANYIQKKNSSESNKDSQAEKVQEENQDAEDTEGGSTQAGEFGLDPHKDPSAFLQDEDFLIP